MDENAQNPSFLTDPSDSKLLRDPIYGYISIPSHTFSTIIDQACFQRLRFIRQTSYEPLYSAALHNRFIHSLGVYYLGRIAFRSFYRAVGSKWADGGMQKWERMYSIFTNACLLHDVGHAPFSHSGEKFFEKDTPKPLERLIKEIGSDAFEKDARDRDVSRQAAAAHEIMSAYVALNAFPELFQDSEEKELFTRCITGYLYTQNDQDTPLSADQMIKNCLIRLLNSSIIDVDRMDYVIRDAYVSGFQNVSIDYQRLLSSISVVPKDGGYQLAYHKSALSVIENVLVAYDSEKKWIQSHPVVLYEHFLIQHAIEVVGQYFSSHLSAAFPEDDRPELTQGKLSRTPAFFQCLNPAFLRKRLPHRQLREMEIPEQNAHSLFSFESLTQTGNGINENIRISLLSDDDIIYSIKNIPQCQNDLTREYFSRIDRRHAIWKSEAEYRALFERTLGPDRLNELESLFAWIENYFSKNVFALGDSMLPIVDHTFLEHCQKSCQQLEQQIKENPNQKDYVSQYDILSKIVPLLSQIEIFMTKRGLPFDLVVVTVKQFRSAFEKQDIDQILVHFPKFKAAYYIRDVSSVLRADNGREKFFYLYYHRGKTEDGNEIKINALEFSKLLCRQLFPAGESAQSNAPHCT